MLSFLHKPGPLAASVSTPSRWERIQLAVSASWRHGLDRLDWIAENHLACAFAPDPQRLDDLSNDLSTYLERGMAVRHHGYFPGQEIGHANARAAEDAVQFHFRVMDAIRGIGEPFMTVHVGLDPKTPLDFRHVVKNLTQLVAYGNKIGVTVSLENLRRGPTSNPHILLDWARRSGAAITLDVGHAVSSLCVQRNEITVEEIIELTAHRLMEVHLYEFETDRHWAPRNMDILGPIVDQLISTPCRWWTIELEDLQEVLHTRQLVTDHFHGTSDWWQRSGFTCHQSDNITNYIN